MAEAAEEVPCKFTPGEEQRPNQVAAVEKVDAYGQEQNDALVARQGKQREHQGGQSPAAAGKQVGAEHSVKRGDGFCRGRKAEAEAERHEKQDDGCKHRPAGRRGGGR